MSKAAERSTLDSRLEVLKSGYAAKFVNDTDEAPTDANIARVLGTCVRPPKPEHYEDIRRYVGIWLQLRSGRVLVQDALYAASLDPPLAREFDARWDGGTGCRTVGDQLKAIDALAVEILRAHGYQVGKVAQ